MSDDPNITPPEGTPPDLGITDDWRETIAGDDADKLGLLEPFKTPADLFDAHQTLANKNWRDDYAGDDDKFKSTLERFNTPADMGKSYRESQATLSAGVYDKPPGEGATDEDIKHYREANNIPLESAGYMENLPDGLVVGEDDKEIMGDFMGVLHKLNVAPQVGHAVIGWYNNFAEQQQDAIADIDSEHKQECDDVLRQDWGSDYRANMNLTGALIEGAFSEEGKAIFAGARDADGRGIMNIPEVMKGLADISRKWNPVAQIVPAGGDPAKTLNDEIADIEKYQREHRTEYFKDEKMQARLRQLYDIRLQHDKVA